jgi:hypothetical protein
MKNNRALVIGASLGLALGILLSGACFYLSSHPYGYLTYPLAVILLPVSFLLSSVHTSPSYDWDSTSAHCQQVILILCYLTLLGFLVGLGWRAFLNRKGARHDA